MKNIFTRVIAVVAILALGNTLFAQCFVYPITFKERLSQTQYALLGSVTEQHSYKDEKGNIYTANKVSVTAWIKNHNNATEVVVITAGGSLNDEAQIVYPAVQLNRGSEYFFMLEANNQQLDDKQLRSSDPSLVQAFPYADAQGAWQLQDNKYHDVFTEGALSEAELLQRINTITGLQAKKTDGSGYTARVASAARGSKTLSVTSFSPNPTNAGTINPSDFLTINGSGFGNIRGRVEFANADNGGATFIAPPNESDYISWTDNQIIVKVSTGNTPTNEARNAGTGTFRVVTANEQVFTSPQQLTVRYSHISINESFSGFATSTRQRYYLRNRDGLGGYTFLYNNTLANNGAAVNAFERAMVTWTCSTGINWKSAGVSTAVAADDDVNIVVFDAGLPSGVLARAISRLRGSAIPAQPPASPGDPGYCDLFNTVWYLKEVDIQIQPNINWQYGPATATAGQFDFETIVLHELGHGHGLGHRIAPGQLMNFAVSSGVNIRTPAPAEVEGGLAKMAYSTMPTCFNPANSGTPMIAAACPLPVRLISFTGELKTYGAELKWKTATEVNTDRFEVQRSNNGIDFAVLGSVKAKGGTTETSYQFIDVNVQQGLNYYRLKIIDKDGSFEYSDVITIRVDEPVKPFVIYPNPVRNELQISATRKSVMNLIDGNGKLVRKIQLDIGNNRISVGNLSSGVYYLTDNEGTRTRLLIMH